MIICVCFQSSHDVGLRFSASATALEHDPKSATSTAASGGKSTILHRIPTGAEATTVLVGAVEFLDKPVMAFVRLSKGKRIASFQYFGFNLIMCPGY